MLYKNIIFALIKAFNLMLYKANQLSKIDFIKYKKQHLEILLIYSKENDKNFRKDLVSRRKNRSERCSIYLIKYGQKNRNISIPYFFKAVASLFLHQQSWKITFYYYQAHQNSKSFFLRPQTNQKRIYISSSHTSL